MRQILFTCDQCGKTGTVEAGDILDQLAGVFNPPMPPGWIIWGPGGATLEYCGEKCFTDWIKNVPNYKAEE